MPEALIWGASGGIGGALVSLLKREGWRVYAIARDESRIPAEADVHCTFDAHSLYSIRAATMHVAQETTGVDLIVYAAGGLLAQPLEQFRESDWAAVFDANLHGAMRVAQTCLPIVNEGGHMMFIGAYVEKLLLPRFSAYAAAKAGLESLVAVMQKEHRKHKFTLVRPGAVDTPFWNNAPFSLPKNAATPESIAAAILAHWQSGETGKLDL